MAIKITAKNKKLNGKFLGDIEFKNGVATVDPKGRNEQETNQAKKRAIVFAERSGLDWEDTSKVKEVEDKKETPKK